MIIDLIQKHCSPLISTSFKPLVCICASVLLVSACERVTPIVSNGLPLPVQTFEHVQRLSVNVSNVQIIRGSDEMQGRMGDFSISLHDRAMQYLSQKFQTTGDLSGSQLVASVEDVQVQHMQRQSNRDFFKSLGVDMVDQYRLRLSLRLEHRTIEGRVLYGKVLSVEKTLNISEHTSLAAREQDQFEAVEDMFAILDPQVSRVIQNEMNL